MKTSILFMSALTEDLKRDEGFRPKSYKCTAGKLTIGYGRNLDDVGISKAEAEILLRNDIIEAQESLDRVFPTVGLSDARSRVLINMVFNLGINRFMKFRKMLAAIRGEDFERAADEMLNSRWAVQVGLRAERLAKLMRDEGR